MRLGSAHAHYVDLDENPALAEAYKVKSIPDVFFIDADLRDRGVHEQVLLVDKKLAQATAYGISR